LAKPCPKERRGPAPGELPELTAEIEESGQFDIITVEDFGWTVDYDAEAYINLLRTFSGHIAMAPPDASGSSPRSDNALLGARAARCAADGGPSCTSPGCDQADPDVEACPAFGPIPMSGPLMESFLWREMDGDAMKQSSPH
jgi:hypothetical protein